MQVFIITGSSRGLGAGIARALFHPNHSVIGVARSRNAALEEVATAAGGCLHQYQQDLADPAQAEAWLQARLQELDPARLDRLVLIHNAGLLRPIDLIGQEADAVITQQAMLLNLVTPMRMTETFTRHTQDWPIAKQVLMISSGAGRKPYPGWSTYCSSKAGLDMFARCLAEEQATHPHPLRVVSLAPGVIDTDMQSLIRQQDQANFPNLQRFLDLKAQGQLDSPTSAGQKIAAFLDRPDFGETVLMDIRE